MIDNDPMTSSLCGLLYAILKVNSKMKKYAHCYIRIPISANIVMIFPDFAKTRKKLLCKNFLLTGKTQNREKIFTNRETGRKQVKSGVSR